MNTITVGQEHYRWNVEVHAWLKSSECTIYNLIDPKAQLSIVWAGTETQFCTPRQMGVWIDAALRQGWHSERKRYRLIQRHQSPYLQPIASSLAEEKALAAQIIQHHPHQAPPTALEKSNLMHQWQRLEQQIGFPLPTALQQLYLTLGNGHFGPDYGFFLLIPETTSEKITLLEAYQDVQQAKIVDWDWELSKETLPFLHWGAAIYSVIDASDANFPVYVLDMNLKKTHSTWQECYWRHCGSLFEWLQKWADDQQSGRSLWLEMYQLRGLL